jgi:hypothetical protein
VKSLGFDRFVALSAQLHEYSRTTRFATDSVAFTVERFKVSADGAFVINEFNHSIRLHSTRPATLS